VKRMLVRLLPLPCSKQTSSLFENFKLGVDEQYSVYVSFLIISRVDILTHLPNVTVSPQKQKLLLCDFIMLLSLGALCNVVAK